MRPLFPIPSIEKWLNTPFHGALNNWAVLVQFQAQLFKAEYMAIRTTGVYRQEEKETHA